MDKKCNALRGVCCSVDSCIHHGSNNECLADNIHVGKQTSGKKTEADCETYCKKSEI